MPIREVAYPRQVILVSSRAEVKSPFSANLQKKDNVMTLSWHTPLSFVPELYAIIIGKTRFSYKLIKESKVFVINFMPFDFKKQVAMAGSMSGEHIDKFKELGFVT